MAIAVCLHPTGMTMAQFEDVNLRLKKAALRTPRGGSATPALADDGDLNGLRHLGLRRPLRRLWRGTDADHRRGRLRHRSGPSHGDPPVGSRPRSSSSVRTTLLTNYVLVHIDVITNHALTAESLNGRIPYPVPVKDRDSSNGFGSRRNVIHDCASRTLINELAHGAPVKRDHRRTAGHCLDDGEAERFVKVDQVKQRYGAPEER